jgi:hypothetical protein
LQELLGIKP